MPNHRINPAEPGPGGIFAFLSNTSNESYLGLDITNPEAITKDMEMALPTEIDQSISARGGTVTDLALEEHPGEIELQR